MSPGVMLSTTSTSHSILPKLTADGSNWIIWKTPMQVFLGAKKLACHIDKKTTPPIEPSALASNADAATTKMYNEELEKFNEWEQGDTEPHQLPNGNIAVT